LLQYQIHYTDTPPALDGQFDAAVWSPAQTDEIAIFHPTSVRVRPQTRFRMLFDDENLHLIFQVHDPFVHSVHTALHDNVCRDSCVEFFVEPLPGFGYFNFEVNCGGTLLLFHIDDPSRRGSDENFRMLEKVPKKLIDTFGIYHSMPRVVDPPIDKWTDWTIQLCIPFAFFREYIPQLPNPAGSTWRANLYKCGTERGHWASWAPMHEEELNFHRPEFFVPICFDAVGATPESSPSDADDPELAGQTSS